jgi:SynChlorMet cassette radical SAM/SPASM protein ScmE
LLLETLGLDSFSTNAAGYLGTCRLNADDIQLTTPDRMTAMATLLRLTQRYPGRISASAGPLAEARMWREMEDARERHAPHFPGGGRLTGCGCPVNRFAVRADGVVVPCNMLAHIELGHINRDSVTEMWQKSHGINDLRERSSIPLAQFDTCADCEYAPYCTGNCPGLAYTLTGKVNYPSPDACLRQFLQDGGTVV